MAGGADLVAGDLVGRNGLRAAGAKALTWSAFDPGRQLLTVELQMDEDDDPGDVKTEESHRTIRLYNRTVDRLEWRDPRDWFQRVVEA